MKRLIDAIIEIGEIVVSIMWWLAVVCFMLTIKIVVGIVWWLVVFYFMLTIRP